MTKNDQPTFFPSMEDLPLPKPISPKAHVDTPAIPRRHIISSFPQYFYSVPTSPTRGLSAFVAACELKLNVPTITSETDSDDDDDDFAFNTAQSFRSLPPREPQHWPRPTDEVPPAMASADELFHDGRLLPLKLPPRLQHTSPQSSPGVSPKSSSFILRRGFPGLGFGKEEFDPFMAAIKQIRKDSAHDQEEELLTERAWKRFKRAVIFGFKHATKAMTETKSKESKPKDNILGWSKFKWCFSRLFLLRASNKGKDWIRISNETESVISTEKEKEESVQEQTDRSQRTVVVEEIRSKSLACCGTNPHRPKLLICFGCTLVSPRT